MQSLSKASLPSKEALKQHFSPSKETTEYEEVRVKLKRLPGFENIGENELSTWLERLTHKEQLHSEFVHLYGNYDVTSAGATGASNRELTSIAPQSTCTGQDRLLQHITQTPVYLCFTDGHMSGQSGTVEGTNDTSPAATLTGLLDSRYGAHRAALVIGDVVIEWDGSSLVMPRQRDTESIFSTDCRRWLRRVLETRTETAFTQHGNHGEQITFTIELNPENKTLIDNLIDVIIRYNKYHYYHVFSRNCQHFVLDAMKALGLQEPPTFTGRMREYYETLRKGRRNGLPNEFYNHEDLDRYMTKNLRTLQPDDLEYFLCQYYGFHHRAAQGAGQDTPREYQCQVPRCQMGRLCERITRESVSLRLSEYER